MNQIFLPSSFLEAECCSSGVADCTQKQLSRFGKVPCLDDQPASKKGKGKKSVLEENSDTRENIRFCGISLSFLFLGTYVAKAIYLEILFGEVSAKKVVASLAFFRQNFSRG